jgi:hypothetical protein
MPPSKPPGQDGPLSGEELAEFKALVLAENLRRFAPMVLLGTAMNAIVLVVELKTLWAADLATPIRLFPPLIPITLIRLALLAMCVVYLVLIGKPGKGPYRFQRAVFLGMAGLGMTLIAVLSGNVLTSQGNTFLYIIAILLLSLLLVLPFREMLAITAPGILQAGQWGRSYIITFTTNAFVIMKDLTLRVWGDGFTRGPSISTKSQSQAPSPFPLPSVPCP